MIDRHPFFIPVNPDAAVTIYQHANALSDMSPDLVGFCSQFEIKYVDPTLDEDDDLDDNTHHFTLIEWLRTRIINIPWSAGKAILDPGPDIENYDAYITWYPLSGCTLKSVGPRDRDGNGPPLGEWLTTRAPADFKLNPVHQQIVLSVLGNAAKVQLREKNWDLQFIRDFIKAPKAVDMEVIQAVFARYGLDFKLLYNTCHIYKSRHGITKAYAVNEALVLAHHNSDTDNRGLPHGMDPLPLRAEDAPETAVPTLPDEGVAARFDAARRRRAAALREERERQIAAAGAAMGDTGQRMTAAEIATDLARPPAATPPGLTLDALRRARDIMDNNRDPQAAMMAIRRRDQADLDAVEALRTGRLTAREPNIQQITAAAAQMPQVILDAARAIGAGAIQHANELLHPVGIGVARGVHDELLMTGHPADTELLMGAIAEDARRRTNPNPTAVQALAAGQVTVHGPTFHFVPGTHPHAHRPEQRPAPPEHNTEAPRT